MIKKESMMNYNIKSYKWAYLPIVLSSVAILVTQVSATPVPSRQAQQVKNINYNYVGGGSNVGVTINDEGDTSIDVNAVLSEDKDSMTSGGLWAGVDLSNDSDVHSGGARLDHNWVVRDKQGKADHINKVYGAYDRNKNNHAKVTVGFGQETEASFWEGHVSKGVTKKKKLATTAISEKAYDYGTGASVGTYLKDSNMRVRGGVDYQWGDEQGTGEDEATLLSLSAGVEKFFQGTPHSVGVDVSADEKTGGAGQSDSSSVRSNLSYRYNFSGDNAFQPDRRYRRVRVEVAGKATPARYETRPVYANKTKNVPVYAKRTTKVPVYGNKTVKVPYKQLVKSTMELEGQTFFKLNRANLIPSAQTRLKQIAAQIRKNGYKGAIRITGNTCKLGDTKYDQRLSEQRAASVRAFLIKEGFNAKHLVARGVGKSNPKYPTTPDQDFKNRRVDIEYVSEQSVHKTGYRKVTKRVQTGTRDINKQVRTGTRQITEKVKVGTKRILVDKGAVGTPRVVWRTEVIATEPTWIKRALHNTIKHRRGVDTYLTTSGHSTVTQQDDTNDSTGGTVTVLNFTQTIQQNTNYVVNVLTGATGEGVTLQSNTVASNGSVTAGVNAGELVYTPATDFVGTDSFTFTVVDKDGNTAIGTVTITVEANTTTDGGNGGNSGNDNCCTANIPVSIGTAGDSFQVLGDNDNRTIVNVKASEGYIEIDGSDASQHSLYFEPDGFVGTATMTYTLSDGSSKTISIECYKD
jgi:outer membrane protein OmpA-like peptidoglycan-associated protein